MFQINGSTEVYGIFGYPVKHSKSPVFQNPAFRFYNINAVYVPFEVEPDRLPTAIQSLRALNIKGINITLPHKEIAINYLDELSEEVKFIKATNTVKNIDGYLIGYNTDAYGFITGLKELIENPANFRYLVIGAGGASRGVLYSLIKEGAKKIYLVNRTVSKAENILKDFENLDNKIWEKISISNLNTIEKHLNDVDIIINTTSVGLKKSDPWLFNYEKLSSKHTVVDIVYMKTTLLQYAEKKGCKYQDGYPMLLYQGAKSFEIWTEKKAPIKVMKEAILNPE